jgi:hypothetical protein
MFLALGIAVLMVVSVVAGRVARQKGLIRTNRGRCELCGASGAVIRASYHQNTGMLIVRQHKTLSATLCKGCSSSAFVRMTGHCAILGWWGFISFFLNCFFILNNIGMWLATLTLPAEQELARSALDEHRDYALALIATKDEDTVVEVLMKQCNASEKDVRAYVRALYPKVAA